MTDVPSSTSEVRLGTRGSALARRQTQQVAELLTAAWPDRRFIERVFSTTGDRRLDRPLHAIGGKGLFTAELEQALRAGEIECAVHSLKDLPVEESEGLIIGAVPVRESWWDVLLCRSDTIGGLAELPFGACVGTSSIRRAAQLLLRRPDLRIADLRGNIETRLRRLRDPEGPYDAIMMAEAAIGRLSLRRTAHLAGIRAIALAADVMLPAPGQGALAVQCRDEEAARALFGPIDDPFTAAAVVAERAFLAGLGGGCSAPVAALGVVTPNAHLLLSGRVCAADGSRSVDSELSVVLPGDERSQSREALAAAETAGRRLAADALAKGAAALVSG